jgi:hypothetical protein
MVLNNEPICWLSKIKYLGVTFSDGAHLSCHSVVVARKFYVASNCIFNNSSSLDVLLQLHLQQSYSLSLVLYGMSSIRLSVSQLKSLNICWNVFVKFFTIINVNQLS